jgi:hypothetical protein
LERVEFYAGGLAGTVTVAVLGDDGRGNPTGAMLGSATYAESATLNWQGTNLIPPVPLVKGTRYHIRYQPVPGSWCSMARGGTLVPDLWSDDSCATWRGPESAFNWKARFYGVPHLERTGPDETAHPADYTMRGRVGLEARVSNVTFKRDTPLVAGGISLETHPKAARSIGGSLTYFVSEMVSLEGYIGYISTSFELSAKDTDGTVLAAAESDVSSVPLLFSVHLRAPAMAQKAAAYALGGFGIYFNDAEDADLSDSFETHIGVGAEYYVSSNSAVNIELRKSWTTPEERVTGVPGLDSVEYDVNPFSIGLGYKHYFQAARAK